ncbi:MAG: hypothetical protein QGI83_14820 [Candidatus Latescibacteria bacterium]|jgi:hypothetical protein|nr:hypothetical protein [Candidatus Latescibacterota bacterium]|tara:strand:- start:229 stop:672 length:444 start_codon:yes stop_codon:yes gene_type:complete
MSERPLDLITDDKLLEATGLTRADLNWIETGINAFVEEVKAVVVTDEALAMNYGGALKKIAEAQHILQIDVLQQVKRQIPLANSKRAERMYQEERREDREGSVAAVAQAAQAIQDAKAALYSLTGTAPRRLHQMRNFQDKSVALHAP